MATMSEWFFDKALPTIIGSTVSALVALSVLYLGRKRELRKLSLDMYKELYSQESSSDRSKTEKMVLDRPEIDWNNVDPYSLSDIDELRDGYANLTRFFVRLSIIYNEKELDRKLADKLFSYVAGYWWGIIYERIVSRDNMYTKNDIVYIFRSFENGSKSNDFSAGYQSALKIRKNKA